MPVNRKRIAAAVLAMVACMALGFGASVAGETAGATIEKPQEVIPMEMLPPETPEAAALRQQIEAEIDAYAARLIEMNDWMYHNPESGYYEFKASKMMGEELAKQGFEVKYGVDGLEEGYNNVIEERFDAGGLPTAFVAKYRGKTEHPVIAFMLEADALRATPAPFHGCQHNMQGPVAIGSGVALAKAMERNNVPGIVWVILTPAEEIPPPDKSAMYKAGVFDEVDFLIRTHGATQKAGRSKAGFGNCCMLIEAVLYDFYGRPAHGTRAWQGADALDAARMFFDAVDMLREHSEPDFRFMGAITKTGDAPNVVDQHVQVDHWIRNANRAGATALANKAEQVDTIAKAAAMATFTDVKIRHYATYTNGIENGWLQTLKWCYIDKYAGPEDKAAMSDDLGEPSGWAECGLPAVNVPGIGIQAATAGIPSAAGHSHENAAITISPEGHKALVQMAKIGAAMGLRLLLDPELRAKVNEHQGEWQAWGVKEGLISEDMIRRDFRKK